MPLSDELAVLDATAQADLVRRKEITPVELVDAAISRIERLNPGLNAVITPMFEQARKTAIEPLPEGPFSGVPFLLKDALALYAGVRLAAGSRFLSQFVPDHDSELVKRHKRAGLIILGKTNTPEFGLLPTTEPRQFGPTSNPWHKERTAGGSSGGSAAAVSAGMAPMAHANDGGGSIRIPAACCGVFGLKPTRARNPLGPDFGDVMGGLAVEHAVTRSVRDSAALLDATSGPDIGDPYCAPPPARPFLEEVGASPGRLRIAFSTKALNSAPVHDDCIRAVHDAARLCSELGHEVTEAAPAIDGDRFERAFMTVWAVGCARGVEGNSILMGRKPARDEIEELTWALAEQGRGVSASTYLLTVGYLQFVSRQIARFFVNFDVWLTPVLAEPPVPLGTFAPRPGNPLYGIQRATAFVPFTPICNVTGQPGMSVPLFWNAQGLPIGTHFAGRFGDEATLFRLAAQLESARPWTVRCPPIAAPSGTVPAAHGGK
jgi:amidase